MVSDHPAGHHIGRIGSHGKLRCPTVPTWRPGLGAHDLVDRDGEVRCRHQRIVPLRHGGGAGVIGEAADLGIVAIDGHDAFHHAD